MREPWLNVKEIAAHLGVSKETIYRMIERGDVPKFRLGKKWLFKASIVDEWIVLTNKKRKSKSKQTHKQ